MGGSEDMTAVIGRGSAGEEERYTAWERTSEGRWEDDTPAGTNLLSRQDPSNPVGGQPTLPAPALPRRQYQTCVLKINKSPLPPFLWPYFLRLAVHILHDRRSGR